MTKWTFAKRRLKELERALALAQDAETLDDIPAAFRDYGDDLPSLRERLAIETDACRMAVWRRDHEAAKAKAARAAQAAEEARAAEVVEAAEVAEDRLKVLEDSLRLVEACAEYGGIAPPGAKKAVRDYEDFLWDLKVRLKDDIEACRMALWRRERLRQKAAEAVETQPGGPK